MKDDTRLLQFAKSLQKLEDLATRRYVKTSWCVINASGIRERKPRTSGFNVHWACIIFSFFNTPLAICAPHIYPLLSVTNRKYNNSSKPNSSAGVSNRDWWRFRTIPVFLGGWDKRVLLGCRIIVEGLSRALAPVSMSLPEKGKDPSWTWGSVLCFGRSVDSRTGSIRD